MAIAFVQESTIQDRSTTNYDAISERVRGGPPAEGLIIHTAGFDDDAGVFRIFDVWETREQAETFEARVMEIVIHKRGSIRQTVARERRQSLFPPAIRASGWSINGAKRSQPVATSGKWESPENGSNKPKPLPPVATGCRSERMVRRGSTVRVRQRA